MKKFHLFLFSISAGLIIAMIGVTAALWSSLPSQIPVHFGFSGAPDAWEAKSLVFVFLVPAIALAIFLGFSLLYRYPQYTNIPQTLLLMALEQAKREHIFNVIRSMLSVFILFIVGLFSYIQFVILATANGRLFGVANLIMIGFLGLLFLALVIFNIRMFFAIRKVIKMDFVEVAKKRKK
jgi:uncharacterized membrane protein